MNSELTRSACARLLHDLFKGRCAKCGQCCLGGNGIGGKMPTCSQQKGYFQNEVKFQEMKAKYGWTDEMGFIGEGGCKIPIEERALTCLEWGCPATMKKFTQEDVNLLNLLRLRIMLLDRKRI